MSMPIEGFDNKKGWWFAGNGSFVSNGYVIYKNGLDPHDPNPIALGYGENLTGNLLGNRDTETNAAFAKIVNVLKSIADASAASEEKYLRLKMGQMLKDNTIEVKWFNKI